MKKILIAMVMMLIASGVNAQMVNEVKESKTDVIVYDMYGMIASGNAGDTIVLDKGTYIINGKKYVLYYNCPKVEINGVVVLCKNAPESSDDCINGKKTKKKTYNDDMYF